LIQARIKEFAIPPITDGLVIGSEASKGLNLPIPDHFEHVTIDDPIVADMLIKSILLRRLTKDRLVKFIVEHIKPIHELTILHVQLDLEISLTGELE
jgi:hypothetical protein